MQLMSLLFTIAQHVGRSSAELTREIVTFAYTKREMQDASVYMVKLIEDDESDGLDVSQ